MNHESAESCCARVAQEVRDVVGAIGIVFGDIGTSPLYALVAIFSLLPVSLDNVVGTVSLIIWTLIFVVSVQYAWLAMSLSKKGEGGTVVLREIIKSLLSSKTAVTSITLMSFVGIALFMGDGVITPAISILGAVEGLRLIPIFSTLSTATLVAIGAAIAVALFCLQRRGVEGVSGMFGPIMVVWFCVIGVSGFAELIHEPSILLAFNPYYGIKCLFTNGLATSAFILSGIILCATGGEALYADMGHMGRRPIRQAWVIVLISLVLNYMGQGAFLLAHPEANLIFHEMFYHQVPWLYVPFLGLCVVAAVIASQAMISGVFAVVYQGITTGMLPRFKVDYTSQRFHAQVYVGFINWLLLGAVVFMMIRFKSVENLAAAYGMAVSGTMLITSTFITLIFRLRRQPYRQALATVLIVINFVFVCTSLTKLTQGGIYSLIIALVPLSIIVIYYFGRKKMHRLVESVPLTKFLEVYKSAYARATKIGGTAVFFMRDSRAVQPYLVQTMVDNGIIYDDNIIVSVVQDDTPYGIGGSFKEKLADGLRVFEIHCGYMEVPNIEKILHNAGIDIKVIFFGLDEIVTRNPVWRIFSIIKRLAPTFVRFHKLPPNKIHGVVTLINM